MLKTKAMRENEEKRFAKNFKYSLIRIRFPDGIYIQVDKICKCCCFDNEEDFLVFISTKQGTFGANETLASVFDFVMGALHHESSLFSLISPDGQKFSNEDSDQTLVALR